MKVLGVNVKGGYLFIVLLNGRKADLGIINVEPNCRFNLPSFTGTSRQELYSFYELVKQTVSNNKPDKIVIRKVNLFARKISSLVPKIKALAIIELIGGEQGLPINEKTVGSLKKAAGFQGTGSFDSETNDFYKNISGNLKYWSGGINEAFAAAWSELDD